MWVGCFQEEIRVFILYECNKEVVTDIFKIGNLFGMFCDYEKKVGIKLILYVCF